KQLYFQGSSNTPDEVESMLASYAREAEMVLEHSPHLKHLNLNDENDFKKAIDIIKKDEGELAEWWAILVHHGTAMVREALAENDTPRAVWAMNKIACYRSMFIFKQNLEEHVWRGYLANQIIYNAASAAAHTPAEAEAINKLKPLFSKMEESVLHTWVKSGLPIGPRIGVKDLPEEMLKALAEWHLSVFQRQIDEDKWNQETRIKLRQNWYQGLTVGMTIIGGLGAVAWTVVQILKAFGKLQSKL
ncbi:MAG: hypothetical protein ACXWPK_19440, partial [Isosphaeraceae bacterium]